MRDFPLVCALFFAMLSGFIEEPAKVPDPDSFKMPVNIEQEFDVMASREEIVKALYETNRVAKLDKGPESNGVHKAPTSFKIEPPGHGEMTVEGTKWTQDAEKHHIIVIHAFNDHVDLLYSVRVQEAKISYRIAVKTREMSNLKVAAAIRVEIKKGHDALLKKLEKK